MRFSAALLTVAAVSCSSPTDVNLVGHWGSQQASLELQRGGGTISYQCGAGSVDSTWTLGADGRWLASGQHYFGGGPVPTGGRPPHPAHYEGKVAGDRLEFTVTLTDLGETLGPYHLTRDGPTVSEICL